MGSDTSSSPIETSSGGRSVLQSSNPPQLCSKTKTKIPKRIHKAEREKQKREHSNQLFLHLANALELNQPNNGKASILSEATRLLKEILGQIDNLKKENVTLLSEFHYVTVEKKELKMENSALQAQVEELLTEVRTRVADSKPDLNVPPPPEYDADAPLGHTLLIVPINPGLGASFPDQVTPRVSKPNPRYATAVDSWPSELLGEPLMRQKEAQLSGGGRS